MLFYHFSEALLYFCFSILLGTFIVRLIPADYKPTILIDRKWLVYSAMAIPILTFMPILQIVFILQSQFGFLTSLANVLVSYKVGLAWSLIFLLSLMLLIYLKYFNTRSSVGYSMLGILLMLGIIASSAWASHAGSIEPLLGFIFDFTHLLSVSVWVGTLFVISWFSKDTKNWAAFLQWFSPTAMTAFGATALSGLFLTDMLVPDYTTGWSTDYGQGLLIKHLLLIPLVFYVLVNGLLVKLKLSKSGFNPIRWARLESILLLAIFGITAMFSQQPPPIEYVTTESVSSLFQFFYTASIEFGMTGHLQLNWTGLFFFVLSVVLIPFLLLSFFKNAPMFIPLLIGITMVVLVYFGLMSIVVFNFIGYCA
ncbi:copper resistance D family protein [Lysinibacillus sp. 54212]|uniref:copper resistance D family protein n=1 Tax=Lysinibacillus sp. 54212 TaxID=3119829 RepID=UPI002FC90F3D